MRIVSDREVLVMFVTPDGEVIARNNSELHKTMQRRRIGKESKGRNRKIVFRIYLKKLS